jgi:hypothetical protein
MKMKRINGRKAEVPIVILVLGVLLLCILITVAGLNSSIFKWSKSGDVDKLVYMEACLSYIEQYDFYKNLGYPKEKIMNLPTFKERTVSGSGGAFLICDSEGIKIKYLLN